MADDSVGDSLSPELSDYLSTDEGVEAILGGADDAPRQKAPIVDTVVLADVEPEKVRYLSAPRLPAGKLVILEGLPDRGKTTLALTAGADITRGRAPFNGGVLIRSSVLFVSSHEDGVADTIRPRVEAAGGDLSRFHVLRGVGTDSIPFSMPEHLPILRAEIERTGAVLVIIDNLMAALAGEVNSWRDQDVRRVLSRLAKVAAETGVCIVVIRHVTKSGGGGKAMLAGGGSIGIIGAARVALLADEDPESPGDYLLAVVKANLARREDRVTLRYRLVDAPEFGCARLDWRGTSEETADTLTARRLTPGATEDATKEKGAALHEAVEWLSDVLAAGPVESGELRGLATRAGLAWRTIGRARVDLDVLVVREGFGRDCRTIWSLPDGANGRTRAKAQHIGDAGTSGQDDEANSLSRTDLSTRANRDVIPIASRRGTSAGPGIDPDSMYLLDEREALRGGA